MKSDRAMNLAVKFAPVELKTPVRSVDQRIRAFLSGDTDGEDVLPEIYDHVLDEPIPPQMLALLRR